MKTQPTHRTVIWLIAALVIGALAVPVATAVAGRPAGMSEQAYAALMARSDGLNKRYHLGVYAVPNAGAVARDQALNDRYGNGATRMSAAEFRGLYLRSVALNRLYHLGDYARQTPVEPAQPTPGDGFDWTKVVLGVAAAIGAGLIGAGMIGGRRHWHPPVAHGH